MFLDYFNLLIFILLIDTKYFFHKFWFRYLYFCLNNALKFTKKFSIFYWKNCYFFFKQIFFIFCPSCLVFIYNILFFSFFDYFWQIFLILLVIVFFSNLIYNLFICLKKSHLTQELSKFKIKLFCVLCLFFSCKKDDLIIFGSIYCFSSIEIFITTIKKFTEKHHRSKR